MKTRRMILLFFPLMAFSIFGRAQNDTLRLYDPSTTTITTYSPATYPVQVARFDLPNPAWIKSFVFTVKDTGSVTVKFCGHEGGVALATLFKEIVPAFVIRNNVMGTRRISIDLPDSVLLMNDQFFLQFTKFTGKLRVVTDRTNHAIPCSSSDGGNYRYQYGQGTDGNMYLLFNDNRAFAVDVVLRYLDMPSGEHFRDVTTEAGIATNLSNSSIAAGDYDGDNFPDLLVSGRLYKNNRNGSFTDVTDTLHIKNTHSSFAANAFVDMDNDGDLDIVLFGRDTSMVFENQNSGFTGHIMHLPAFKAFLSFSFADINNDNYPDLFVGQLWATYPEPEPNFFFYNNKNFDFTDNTKVIYPEYDGKWDWPSRAWDPANYVVERNRNSRGSQWVDFDNDGDPDLYVTNYFLQQDEFYRNNGDGTFTDICVAKNIDRNNGGANHGTGVDWYDYNNDGFMDLLLPQFAHPHFLAQGLDHRATAIYKNNGPPDYSFTDIVGQYGKYPGLVSPSGLEMEETHAGGAWGDIDNDGLADFLMTVFYGCRYIELYHQKPDHTFELVTNYWGLGRINTGTDLVWLDYDCDGKLDLACGNAGKFRLYKNYFLVQNYVELNLKSTSSNKYAIGARVTVYAGGQKYTQEVCAGRGQKMQKPYTLHYGIGNSSTIDSVLVSWPSNPRKTEVFRGIEPGHVYLLTEGGNVVMNIRNESKIFRSFEVYPNPASDKVNMVFGLKEGAKVRLEIINMQSQAMTVVDEGYRAKGDHRAEITISTDQYPGGTYLCRLVSGKETLTKMFIVGSK